MYACRHTLLVFYKHNSADLVHIQAIKYKKDTSGHTAAEYHHRNYQAYISFVVDGEEERQKLVHSLALKKPLAMRR
jgi:hypothetical protein